MKTKDKQPQKSIHAQGKNGTGLNIMERPLANSLLWGFVAIVILYAFAEGTFANWSIVYLIPGGGFCPGFGFGGVSSA